MFIGALCNAVYTWMLANPSPDPQMLFYIDEVAPYVPPVRKPACKDSLMLLLRQARKYGVCCLLATQSPGDLDYKALGQIGTWMLGRMRTEQEAWKVEPALAAQPDVDSRAIVARLPSFEQGQFVISSPDTFPEPEDFNVRWLVTAHRTVNESGVEELVSDEDRESLG
jgi:DNA helicase HerA-like ATPase